VELKGDESLEEARRGSRELRVIESQSSGEEKKRLGQGAVQSGMR
jgi:hypothetical protein